MWEVSRFIFIRGIVQGAEPLPNGLNLNLVKGNGAGIGWRWIFTEKVICRRVTD